MWVRGHSRSLKLVPFESLGPVSYLVVSEERDHGVIMSEDLKWKNSVLWQLGPKQGNKILGMIKRNFTDRSEETIMSLYKSLVRPHLEFCTPVRSPHLVKDSKLIEGVQCRATKLVQGIEHWKYENRLTYLRLPRLDMRRVRCDLIDTFKIMNSIYDVHSELYFNLDEGGRRGHEKKLFK